MSKCERPNMIESKIQHVPARTILSLFLPGGATFAYNTPQHTSGPGLRRRLRRCEACSQQEPLGWSNMAIVNEPNLQDLSHNGIVWALADMISNLALLDHIFV